MKTELLKPSFFEEFNGKIAEPASAPDTKSPRVFFFSHFRAKRRFCQVLIGFWRR